MLLALCSVLKDRRRPQTARRTARARRPLVEPMEGRRLLSSLPYLLATNPQISENDAPGTMAFKLTLTAPSAVPVTVSYTTADATATAGQDYVAEAGTATFAPGQTALNVAVPILRDPTNTQNQSFYLRLSGATNANLLTPNNVGTITAPQAAALSIADVTMTRGLGGTKTMVFTVSLNADTASPVTVTASTSDLTARAGVDYAAKTQLLTIRPGQRTAQFAVTIYGSPTTVGAQKFFQVKLSGAGVPLSRPTAAGILLYGA